MNLNFDEANIKSMINYYLMSKHIISTRKLNQWMHYQMIAWMNFIF